MRPIIKSNKLDTVCYDIRGPVHKEARRLEDEGHRILKLNIGNPAPFGFEAPEEIVRDVILNLPSAQGYCESKGLFSARKAIVQHYQAQGCLLYTSDAADDMQCVDLGGRRIIKKIFFKQKTAYEIMPSLVGSEMCIRDRRTPNRTIRPSLISKSGAVRRYFA